MPFRTIYHGEPAGASEATCGRTVKAVIALNGCPCRSIVGFVPADRVEIGVDSFGVGGKDAGGETDGGSGNPPDPGRRISVAEMNLEILFRLS